MINTYRGTFGEPSKNPRGSISTLGTTARRAYNPVLSRLGSRVQSIFHSCARKKTAQRPYNRMIDCPERSQKAVAYLKGDILSWYPRTHEKHSYGRKTNEHREFSLEWGAPSGLPTNNQRILSSQIPRVTFGTAPPTPCSHRSGKVSPGSLCRCW